MIRLPSVLLAAFCCVITLCCLTAQEPKDGERSVQQELAALIAKTNALETFHAIYDMTNTAEGESGAVSLELVYRAPDLGRVRLITPDGGVDYWIVGNSMYFHSDDPQAGKDWRRDSFPEPSELSNKLDELFPLEEKVLEPGVFFRVTMKEASDSAKAAFNISLGGPVGVRPYVLGWLDDMRGHSSDVSIEGDALIWSRATQRCVVSRKTGFLETVESTAKEGGLQVRLRECQRDEPLDPSLITLPAEARDAAKDPTLLAGIEQVFSTDFVRFSAFLRVERQLRSEKRTWNERTRTDWRNLLAAVHRETLRQELSAEIDEERERIDQLASWAHTQRVEDDSARRLAGIEQQVAENRAGMAKRIDQREVKYSDRLSPVESNGIQPRQELFDLEHKVVESVYREVVREPLLMLFDEKLGAALQR